MYNKDDIVYILENDQVVRKAKVAGRQDDLYIVQLIGCIYQIRLKKLYRKTSLTLFCSLFLFFCFFPCLIRSDSAKQLSV